MRIAIIGGSNSQIKMGYSHHVKALLPDESIINLAIGAAPSHMGLFRLLNLPNSNKLDIVIWEYALNDINHIKFKGYDEDDLLAYVEHSLKFCARRGIAALPVVMTPLPEERVQFSSYRAKLHFLFSHYGVSCLDVSHVLRYEFGVRFLGKDYFKDANHYHPDGEVVTRISQRIASFIQGGIQPPLDAAPLFIRKGSIPRIYRKFRGANPESFGNSSVSFEVFDPGQQLLIDIEKKGRLVAMVVLASRSGGVVDVRAGSRTLRVSLVHDEPKFKKPLVKIVVFPKELGDLAWSPGDRCSISWASSYVDVFSDMGFSTNSEGMKGRDGRVIGLLVEEELKR